MPIHAPLSANGAGINTRPIHEIMSCERAVSSAPWHKGSQQHPTNATKNRPSFKGTSQTPKDVFLIAG